MDLPEPFQFTSRMPLDGKSCTNIKLLKELKTNRERWGEMCEKVGGGGVVLK